MKKEIIWGFYLFLILILSILGYVLSTENKMEYGLAGMLLGVLLSLILWIVWGSKNADN